MKFEIRSRWDNSIMFEIEADSFVKAVEKQIAERADLRGADLYGANLYGARIKTTQTEQLIKSLSIIVED